jgi:hypothetical protein
MDGSSSSDRIDFLVRRFRGDILLRQVARGEYQDPEERRNKIEEYRAELLAKDPRELQELYKEERAKERVEAEVRPDWEDRQRFFNQPHAKADFIHWSKAAHWTLDEAVALSFGKEPTIVNWNRVQKYTEISRFAGRYAKLRELTLRAKEWKQLYDPVLPGLFLAWAKRYDIGYPPELEQQVIARGHDIADWKTSYDELKLRSEEAAAAAERALADGRRLVAELVRERESLRERVGQLEEAAREVRERPLLSKERDSALKLIIGMAIEGYKYDPGRPRNEATQEIFDDLALVGVSLDPDTVRKWLREASQLLPRLSREGQTD